MVRSSFRCIAFFCIVVALIGMSCKSKENAGNEAVENRERSVKIEQIDQAKDSRLSVQSKPKNSSIENPKYQKEEFFGAWTTDPNGPHANFEINNEYYFIVDQDGNANMIYTVNSDSITVYFDDFTSRGQITKAENDTLIINWDNQGPTVYTRWKG